MHMVCVYMCIYIYLSRLYHIKFYIPAYSIYHMIYWHLCRVLCSSKSMLVSNCLLINESHCMFIPISDPTFIHALDSIWSLALYMLYVRFDIRMPTLNVMFIPCFCHTYMRYHIHAYITAYVHPRVGLYIHSCVRPYINACLHVCQMLFLGIYWTQKSCTCYMLYSCIYVLYS